MSIRILTYQEIEAFWEAHLWPRPSESLRPLSAMLLDGGLDPSIKNNFLPVFFGYFEDGSLVGVNSGHLSSDTEFRSRGLCVLEEFRGRGYGLKLLEAAEFVARRQGALKIWSYPKETAWPVYQKAGYRKLNRKLKEEDANSYALLELV